MNPLEQTKSSTDASSADSRLTLKEQLALCQQVARLVRSRLPISGQLSQLSSDASSSLARTANSLDQQLAGGKSLRQALAGENSRDSRILAACIDAGEQSGRLDEMLDHWMEMHLDLDRYSRLVRSALLYPALLIAITLCSLGYVFWRLIPEYRTTYAMFNVDLPTWLAHLVNLRERMGVLVLLLFALLVLPLAIWFLRRRKLDASGLPREIASRLRVQSLATQLLQTSVASGLPLSQSIPLSVLASGGDPSSAERSFDLVRQQTAIPQLARETFMLLASLHAGLVSQPEASEHLATVASYLRQQAAARAAREARWLPMLVALIVGGLTIVTYVTLIYLPWILLLQSIVAV